MPTMPTSRTIPRLLDELGDALPRPRGTGRRRRALHLCVAARRGARLRQGPARARRAQGRQGRDPDGQQARMDRRRPRDLPARRRHGRGQHLGHEPRAAAHPGAFRRDDADRDRPLSRNTTTSRCSRSSSRSHSDAAAAAHRACRRAAVSRFACLRRRVRARARCRRTRRSTRPQRAIDPQDVAYILYTSGSTSTPKGVQLQHYALIENMWHIGERMHVTEHDRLWLAVSLFWGLGCENALFNLMTHGGCVVLQESFEPGEALRLISAGALHASSTACPTWCRRSPSIRTGRSTTSPACAPAARSARPSSCSASSISA